MKYDRLIVDGYNIIGAWPEFRTLREQDFELARERLVDAMAEYQAVTGISVTIVFDAYLQPGRESRIKKSGIEVIYTRENETADEWIEKTAAEWLQDIRVKLTVATNDFTEQWVIFTLGALRISAQELRRDWKAAVVVIRGQTSVSKTSKKPRSTIDMPADVIERLEQIRRLKTRIHDRVGRTGFTSKSWISFFVFKSSVRSPCAKMEEKRGHANFYCRTIGNYCIIRNNRLVCQRSLEG
ncbi:NYN domain-containing protein [Exiguobacterium antarcticum]|uniref:NYN domain-containing protein n=1 Tax=Exiguobacterium antarcticum TaxID=132920 RepID=UPI000285EE59|nr:hypothetical protein Eab7_0080 [Exiguobacterium antarcticum B7]